MSAVRDVARLSGEALHGHPALRAEWLERRMLGILYDAGGEMGFADLHRAMPCPRRELWSALRRQYGHGNVQRHPTGAPIRLTAGAMIAIAAGRGGRVI